MSKDQQAVVDAIKRGDGYLEVTELMADQNGNAGRLLDFQVIEKLIEIIKALAP